MVVVSAASFRTTAVADEVPAKVCVPVKVLATLTTGILAPAKVVAPVPPEPIAKVADKPAAVPVVFWFSVGTSPAWMAAKTEFVPLDRRY